MINWIFRKFLAIAVMAIAPAVSARAFYEYFQVGILHQKPSYPFGKEVTDALYNTHIDQLSSYQNEMLIIGATFLCIAVLVYLGTMIKALSSLVFIGVIAFAGYALYLKFGSGLH